MNKVLMITTHFAPDIHVGAKRMTKFAKYLPLYGWQPVILTKEVSEYHGIDESLSQELPLDLSIYCVKEWRLSKAQAPSNSVMPGWTNQKDGQSMKLRRHLLKLADFFLFYDHSWLLPAFLTARRLLRRNDIPVIYSSIPNPEAHLVALLLKLTLPVKWVCEYRDPWTRAPVSFYPPASPLQPLVEWALERQVLAQADRLIFIGPKNRDRVLEGRLAHLVAKSAILYNGYDEEDFLGLSCDNAGGNSCFTIGYIGTFGRWRTPKPFLRAMGKVLRQKPELRDRIRVRLIGEVKFDPDMKEQIAQIIQQEGLSNMVRLEPFVPYREALKQMFQCHCLLLIQNYIPEAPRYGSQAIGAKTFEYFRVQKPILAVVPPEGDVAQLIRELRAGLVAAPYDVDGIGRAILELYEIFCRGELSVDSDLANIQQFERRAQAGQLARLFERVIANG